MIGGYQMRLGRAKLDSEAALAGAMTFTRTLADQIDLSPALYSTICPVEIADRQFAILCTDKALGSGELEEVVRALHKRGYRPADGIPPNLFVTSVPVLVLSVSKGHITGQDLLQRKKVQGNSAESTLWKNFVDIVGWAIQENASDIHMNIVDLAERSQIKFHIDGQYVGPERFIMPTSVLTQMAQVVFQQSRGGNGPKFQPLVEQQCRIFLEVENNNRRESVMLRWASMATDDGPQITLRGLRLDAQANVSTLESLGYLPSQRAQIERVQMSLGGAIIATGVLGSGKTTLLATLMNNVKGNRKKISIEDPREYVLPGTHQNTVVRTLDSDDDGAYRAKVRTLKRAAVNDFMLGEIRDKQTGAVFQDMLEAGINVYTTVHERRHFRIPGRLAGQSIGVDRGVLATPANLKLLIAQVLLPVNCPECSISVKDVLSSKVSGFDAVWFADYFKRIERLFSLEPTGMRLRNPMGCQHCRRDGLPELAGYRGRIVAAELLEPDDTLLELVRDSRNIELEHYVDSMPRAALDNPNADNKSALEVAMYHVKCGTVDPRMVEPRFEAFETLELRRIRSASKARTGLKVVG
ncbi:MAG: ATPase, T2SS/T4P/T4SS family [Burkholderiaceae bacterium]|nr:ATPase, T2SS/T4P/T4SS family [Burkholderiaceae bacterium]